MSGVEPSYAATHFPIFPASVFLYESVSLGHSSIHFLGPVGLVCDAFCLAPTKVKTSKTSQIKLYFLRRKNFRVSGRQRKIDVTAACIRAQQRSPRRTVFIQSPNVTPCSGEWNR